MPQRRDVKVIHRSRPDLKAFQGQGHTYDLCLGRVLQHPTVSFIVMSAIYKGQCCLVSRSHMLFKITGGHAGFKLSLSLNQSL
jgi:hypothetical protein